MAETYLDGPVIGGLPQGYPPYWSIRKGKATSRRPKPGNLIANPTSYSSYEVRRRTEPDSYSGSVSTPMFGQVGVNPDAHLELNQMRIRLASLSDSRTLEKIKNEKWNLGTFLGELPQTQAYLRTAIPRMVDIYLGFKKRMRDPKWWRSLVRRGKRFFKSRKRRGAMEGSAGMAAAWLEFRYAIMPLTYDVQDMLTWLYNSALRMPIFRVASGASDAFAEVFRSTGPFSPSRATTATIQVRTACYYSASAEADAMKRLGLINLPAVLWELTPLSFVADMVLPIGDFIANFDAMVGVSVLSCTRSTRTDMVDIRASTRYYTSYFGGSSGTGRFYSRVVIPAPVNLPIFTKSPSGKQLADVVALSRQILFSSR